MINVRVVYFQTSGPENGIVMENSHSMDFTLSHTVEQQQQQQQQKQHTSLSHSKSAVLNKLQQSEDKPHKLPRNFSDSSIQEVTKRSTSPTDSMYSSDSIGSSLDIQDNVEGGRGTRGTSPANLDNPTTEVCVCVCVCVPYHPIAHLSHPITHLSPTHLSHPITHLSHPTTHPPTYPILSPTYPILSPTYPILSSTYPILLPTHPPIPSYHPPTHLSHPTTHIPITHLSPPTSPHTAT